MNSTIKEKLEDIYFDISNPASYSGIDRLYKEAKRNGIKISKKNVKHFLHSLSTYTIYSQTRKHFKRAPVFAWGLYYLYDADLADLTQLKHWNSGYGWLLVVVCVFSRRIFIRKLKSKKGKEVSEQIKNIFSHLPVPPLYL